MPTAESELLRAFRDGFEQGNRAWNVGDVKTAYAALPDQLEYRLAPTWPEARVLRSRDEVIEFFEDFQETFRDARTTPHEYLEGAHGIVVVGFRVAGTGRTSGVESEMEIWQAWEIRSRIGEKLSKRPACPSNCSGSAAALPWRRGAFA
jgi:ketosteroid isomerase-like protein